ncbi:MAG: hypothetical protein PHQ08_02855 [Candidatus Pacebacteria bacterium]|nr:hypothetical protein [Candidatus Paceibacterota bacterium]
MNLIDFAPLVSFVLLIFFLLLISLFIYGEFLIRKGKANLGFEISSFAVKILSTLVIISIFFLLIGFYFAPEKEKEEELTTEIEFPESPASFFPPSVEYIEVGGYYFKGPFILDESVAFSEETVIAVFCKAEDYKMIYVGTEGTNEKLISHFLYPCFKENCKEDLYYASLYVKKEETEEIFQMVENRRKIVGNIREKVDFVCQ